MFAWTIYLSALGAIGCLFCKSTSTPRLVALSSAIAAFAAAVAGLLSAPGGGLHTVCRVDWIPFAGIEFYLAADGISVTLVLLTGIAAIAGILFSWNVQHRPAEFFALFLTLIAGVYGVFLSFDIFLLFVFYEIAIIPKYFLIAIWGSTRREYAAMKLALYSFAGSAMVLAGIIMVYALAGSTDLLYLTKVELPRSAQLWLFPMVFIGFGILAGLWPFHTWAPTGHVAAPTAASMLLAGVVMKLGAYGCLRVALPLFPAALKPWDAPVLGLHSWPEVFALLAVVGIVYGALAALAQGDFKFVIGYSSVSHMGFVLLGMVTFHKVGLAGSVLQMFSHGIIAGLLFAVVGRMVYDRTHTRDLAELRTFGLNRTMPFAAVVFIIAALAGMGLPGFSGFIAELQVLIGSWHAYPTLTVIAGAGIVIAVAYSLRAIQQGFFKSTLEPEVGEALSAPVKPMEPITVPECLGAGILIISTLAIGLFPGLLLRWIIPALGSPYFEKVLKGGAQ